MGEWDEAWDQTKEPDDTNPEAPEVDSASSDDMLLPSWFYQAILGYALSTTVILIVARLIGSTSEPVLGLAVGVLGGTGMFGLGLMWTTQRSPADRPPPSRAAVRMSRIVGAMLLVISVGSVLGQLLR